MNRATALTFLVERFSLMYTKARMSLTDTAPAGFKTVIDDTWTKLGLDPSDTEAVVPSGQGELARAILRYMAYWHACDYLANRYSRSVAGMSLQFFQVYQAAKELMVQAEKEARAEGYGGTMPSYAEIVLQPRKTVNRTYLGGLTEFGY